MGFFGTYEFNGSEWSDADPDEPPAAEAKLWVCVYDSDFSIVRYAPAGPGTGVAYMGFTPRFYFESEDASAPTDVAREALGLATWWAERRADSSAAEVMTKQVEIAGFLAADEEPSDDADVFVEDTTVRLLLALDVPLPQELASLGQ